MKNTIILMAIAGICVGAGLLHAADTQDKATQQERVKWVSRCMTELQSVKPGMTRAEVEKEFQMDGGLQGYVTVRYIHPECSYFKLDVKFLVKRNAEDQGRVVPTPKDKALSVSKPYIENPYCD
jgi:hypothetical protein